MNKEIKDDVDRQIKAIQETTLFDDLLFQKTFGENIKLTEILLKAYLHKDLKIIEIKAQNKLANLYGKSAVLDILAIDDNGIFYNIDVNKYYDDIPHRARYYGGIIDVNHLNKGDKYSDIPEVYIIFILNYDYLQNGSPYYLVDRFFDTGEKFDDGLHVLIINGLYRGDDMMGNLMHDFSCRNTSNMRIIELANAVSYNKDINRGGIKMCQTIKDMIEEAAKISAENARKQAIEEGMKAGKQEGIEQGILIIVKNMLQNGLTIEQTANYSGLSVEQVKKIKLS